MSNLQIQNVNIIEIVTIVTSMHLTGILHEHYYLVGSTKSPQHPHTKKQTCQGWHLGTYCRRISDNTNLCFTLINIFHGNDVEPHQGRVLQTHPRRVNHRCTIPPARTMYQVIQENSQYGSNPGCLGLQLIPSLQTLGYTLTDNKHLFIEKKKKKNSNKPHTSLSKDNHM